MAKLTLQDVFKMFEPFGITARQVTATLNACADKTEAFNTFEGLKSLATARYEEMRGGSVSSSKFQEVKPVYEGLMKIQLKNYNPPRKESDLNEKVRTSANIYEMLRKKDVDGLMSMLSPESSEDKKRTTKFVDDLLKEMNRRNKK